MERKHDVLIKVRHDTRKSLKILSAQKGKSLIDYLDEFAQKEIKKGK